MSVASRTDLGTSARNKMCLSLETLEGLRITGNFILYTESVCCLKKRVLYCAQTWGILTCTSVHTSSIYDHLLSCHLYCSKVFRGTHKIPAPFW